MANIVLSRGRKQHTLIRNVTDKEWQTFMNHAEEGLNEYGRQWHNSEDDDSIVVLKPNGAPLYIISLEKN